MVNIDIYDDDAKYLGKIKYSEALDKGFWYNVVFSFVYDREGYVYFCLDDFFTIFSGYIFSLEAEEDTIFRTLRSKISFFDLKDVSFVMIAPYKKNNVSKGVLVEDKILANFYICEVNNCKFEDTYLKINVKDLLKIFSLEEDFVFGDLFINDECKSVRISTDNFVLNDYEMSMDNYLLIFNRIAENTIFIK